MCPKSKEDYIIEQISQTDSKLSQFLKADSYDRKGGDIKLAEKEKLAKLEALLYAAGRPLGLTQIVTILQLEDEREASSLMKMLSEIYEKDNSVLEIQRLPQEKVVLQLKSDYTKQASRVSIKPLLTDGPLRTLSYVAYHQPVEQTEVALARGSHSYKHLKMLEDIGLIKRIKAGRTKIVRTTQDFADHLGLSQDRTSMRRELRKLFRKLEVEQMEKNNMRVRIN